MANIKINGVRYVVKYSLKACIIQERITGEIFSLDTLTKQYTFFYSMLLANNDNVTLSFSEFIDVLPDNPSIIDVFYKVLNSALERQRLLSNTDDETNDNDKKKGLQ